MKAAIVIAISVFIMFFAYWSVSGNKGSSKTTLKPIDIPMVVITDPEPVALASVEPKEVKHKPIKKKVKHNKKPKKESLYKRKVISLTHGGHKNRTTTKKPYNINTSWLNEDKELKMTFDEAMLIISGRMKDKYFNFIDESMVHPDDIAVFREKYKHTIICADEYSRGSKLRFVFKTLVVKGGKITKEEGDNIIKLFGRVHKVSNAIFLVHGNFKSSLFDRVPEYKESSDALRLVKEGMKKRGITFYITRRVKLDKTDAMLKGLE